MSKTCRGTEQRLSFLSSYQLIIYAENSFLLSTERLYSWPVQTSSGEDAEDFFS